MNANEWLGDMASRNLPPVAVSVDRILLPFDPNPLAPSKLKFLQQFIDQPLGGFHVQGDIVEQLIVMVQAEMNGFTILVRAFEEPNRIVLYAWLRLCLVFGRAPVGGLV
jgi:hypothetical protein